MRKCGWLVLVFALMATTSLAQVYVTVGPGDWDDISIWQADGSPATEFPTATNSSSITVQHAVDIAAGSDGISIDQTAITAAGTLNVTGFSISVADGTGIDLSNAGVIASDPGGIEFLDGASYRHNRNGGALPNAIWNENSVCEVFGVTNTAPTNLNQNFWHFTWNSNQTANINLNGGLNEVIFGDLTISNTGSANDRLRFFADFPSDGQTLTVFGNLIISGGSSVAFTNTGTNAFVYVDLDVTLSSSRRQTLALGDGSVVFTVNGSVTNSNNLLRLTGGGGSTAALEIFGNFNLGGTGLSAVTGSTAEVQFRGGSTNVFTRTGTPSQTGPIRWQVLDNGTLDIIAGSFLSGSTTTSSFLLTSGATLITRDVTTTGAIRNVTSAGCLRVAPTTGRTFEDNSVIIYQGAAAQFLGDGHPSTGLVETRINNSAGVTTVGSRTIPADLYLDAGNLNAVGGSILTLEGQIFPGSNFITVSATTDLVLNGSGLTGTFPFPAGAITLRDFRLNRPGGNITFGNNVTISRTLTLTDGDLIFTGRTLTLNGTMTATGGSLFSSSPTSTALTIGGAGTSAFGTLSFAPSPNNQIGTLTVNRTSTPNTVTLSGGVLIGSAFNLQNGTFDATSGTIHMESNSTLTRSASGATITGSRPFADPGETYNVSYSGTASFTTGNELPDPANDTDLGNLTFSGSGTITLGQNLTINGNVNLNGGTFNGGAGSFLIDMEGPQWNDNAGTFAPATGTVVFNSVSGTTIGGSSTPLLGSVTLTNAGSLTLPNGPINISGNIQINSGGTLNANNTNTVLNLSGTTTTDFAGGGKLYRNIALTKSAGFGVTLSSGVLLTGTLTITNNNCDFASNGFLTLVSDASGTASIGTLLLNRTVSGDVNYQRFVSGVGASAYRDVSFPVTGGTLLEMINGGFPVTGTTPVTSFGGPDCPGCVLNNPSIYSYDETVAGAITLGYNAVTSSSFSFLPGVGYNVFLRSAAGNRTVRVTGPINRYPTATALPVTYTNSGNPAADGWNFIGNPFPSTIDWDIAVGWTNKATIQGNQISVWDPTKNAPAGGYRLWNGTDGDHGSGRIASGQGFWVQRFGAGAALTINEQAKNSTAGTFRLEVAPPPGFEIVLRNTQNNDSDFAYVQLDEAGQLSLDPRDGIKLNSPYFNISTLSEDRIPLSINVMPELPANGMIHLKITEVMTGSFALKVNARSSLGDTPVYVFDKFLNKSAEITREPYVFAVTESPVSQPTDRFYLYFSEKNSSIGSVSGIRLFPVPVENELSVLVADEEIASEIQVLDQMGRNFGFLEVKEDAGARIGKLDMSGAAPGVYFVRASRLGKPLIVKFVKR